MSPILATLPLLLPCVQEPTIDVAGKLLVDLNALHPSAGTQTWVNKGTLADFTRRGMPMQVRRGGVAGVALQKGDGYEGPKSAKQIEQDQTRTIEVWAWNPDLEGEETLISWGARESGQRRNLALNFGDSRNSGAAHHWGADIGWGDDPEASAWSHLAYTYDGESVRLFYNGSQMAQRKIKLDTLEGRTIRLGGQSNPDGAWTQEASLVVARVRVHSEALTPAEVGANFEREKEAFGARPWSELRKVRLADPQLRAKINTAIADGAEAMLARQELDGSWRHRVHDYSSGMTGLAVYTLIKCGLPRDHPAIRRGIGFIVNHPPDRTYSVGCVLMALGTLPEGHHDELVEGLTELLIDWQQGGGWAYPHGATDLSNTQYAMLGLRAAAARGVRVPNRVWAGGASYAMRQQGRIKRGEPVGFAYHGGGVKPSASMTAAGVSVLAMARQATGKTDKSWEAGIEAGLAWLGEEFSVHVNRAPRHEGGTQDHYLRYYQYGLERVGSLLNVAEIGGRDWYTEGAVALLDDQEQSGMWGDQSNTCFALLFLTRATSKAPTTGRNEAGTQINARFGEDDSGADVSLRGSGRGRVSIWLSSFGRDALERLSWEGDAGRLRVAEVSYYVLVNGERELVEQLQGDPDSPPLDERFAIQRSFEPGEHKVVAEITVKDPAGEVVTLTSSQLVIEVASSSRPELLGYATGADSELAGAKLKASSSSKRNNDRSPEKIADGYTATFWEAGDNDAEPWLRIELDRSIRADRVVLVPQLPDGAKDARAKGSLVRVELLLNGKGQIVDLDESAWKKTTVVLEKTTAIRSLEVRVLELRKSRRASLAEVELVRDR